MTSSLTTESQWFDMTKNVIQNIAIICTILLWLTYSSHFTATCKKNSWSMSAALFTRRCCIHILCWRVDTLPSGAPDALMQHCKLLGKAALLHHDDTDRESLGWMPSLKGYGILRKFPLLLHVPLCVLIWKWPLTRHHPWQIPTYNVHHNQITPQLSPHLHRQCYFHKGRGNPFLDKSNLPVKPHN